MPSVERMFTPPCARPETLTFINPDSVFRSWFCRFCDPVASPPLTWARAMSLFRLAICCSRVLTCETSVDAWLSMLVESALIWVLIALAELRKLVVEFSAAPRSRVEDGSFAAVAKALEILSGRLKK